MMSKPLENKRVAILATDGFEESELLSPKQALEGAGAKVDVVSLKHGSIKGWKDGNWSQEVPVDRTVEKAMADDYDALMLPGGVINPDHLRRSAEAVEFVRGFFREKKPVAAICHGPQLLIEADIVRDRKLTSFPSVRTDLMNAGAMWQDSEVVTDNGLVTSRSPKDLPAFNKKMVEEISEGVHERQTA
jgi:protease I